MTPRILGRYLILRHVSLIIGVFLPLLVIGACNRSNESHEDRLSRTGSNVEGDIKLELQARYGDSDLQIEGLLASVDYVQIDRQQHVYIFDGRTTHLVSYNEDGSIRWALDNVGKGPGELRGVYGFAWDGDSTLYISNQFGSRIDRFTTNGEYVDSNLTEEYGLGRLFIVGFLDNGRLVMKGSLYGKLGVRISIWDVSEGLAVADTFTVNQSGDSDIPDNITIAPVVSTIGDAIVLAHVTEYRYTWYNPSGSIIRSIARSDVEIQPPSIFGSELGSSLQQFSEMFPVVSISDRLLLGGGSWPTNVFDPNKYSKLLLSGQAPKLVKMTSLDLMTYDSDEPIRTLDADAYGISHLLAADSDGDVYAKLKGQSVVARYKVITGYPGSN